MLVIDNNMCPQNHRCPCINVCPVGAISQKDFALPVINQEVCIECGKCIVFCPMEAIKEQFE